MKNEMDIQESLRQLKPMADSTILRGLSVTPETERRILERIQAEELEHSIPLKHPRRYLLSFILFATIVISGLTAIGFIHSRHKVQSAVMALGTSVVEISPVTTLGFLMMKHALQTTNVRLNTKSIFSPVY